MYTQLGSGSDAIVL